MGKYKYILKYENGETYDSYEEYGDDDFQGTFKTYEAAEEAALYAISCTKQGSEILNMSNPGDYDYDENEEITYEIEEID